MAINTLATATLFQTTLDKVAVQDAVTGWMEGNAGQVIYNGGADVKIPKMSVQGLADYNRDTIRINLWNNIHSLKFTHNSRCCCHKVSLIHIHRV